MSEGQAPTREIFGAAIRVFGDKSQWDEMRGKLAEEVQEVEGVLEGALDRAFAKSAEKFKQLLDGIIESAEKRMEAIAFQGLEMQISPATPAGDQVQPSQLPTLQFEQPSSTQAEVRLDADSRQLLQQIRDGIGQLTSLVAQRD
jgi:hypothetical protein